MCSRFKVRDVRSIANDLEQRIYFAELSFFIDFNRSNFPELLGGKVGTAIMPAANI